MTTPPIVRSLDLLRDGQPVSGFFAVAFHSGPAGTLEPSALPFLTAPEAAYAEALRFPIRRKSFLLGRIAAKCALQSGFNIRDPREIEIARGVFEQPVVLRPAAELSIAHSDNMGAAVCAAPGHPIAIDFEQLNIKALEALLTAFSEAEQRMLHVISTDEQSALFCGWTMKEALAKILRCGLMTPFHILEIESIQSNIDRSSNSFESRFTHFPQYKGVTWLMEKFALTIVLPARTSMKFDPREAFAEAVGS